jgi:hypothetical protein
METAADAAAAGIAGMLEKQVNCSLYEGRLARLIAGIPGWLARW